MDAMARSRRLPAIVGWAVALGLAMAVVTPAPTASAAVATWGGGVDLYRVGTFTTQKSWLWCTAAGVQIVDNIVDHRKDHTTASQRRYFDWMRTHNRYALPLSAGVDPAGWTAGLRHYVDDRYRLVASRTFDEALRSAVTHLRQTGLPVAITVSHGGHGWILVGFRATADPATTTAFTVTSVRVVGPLYGLQSKNGYDMPPNTKLTPAQLKGFFTPWKYAPKPMIWDGRYVSIQPIPAKRAVAAAASPAPRAAATATPATSLLPTPSPSMVVVPTTTAEATSPVIAAMVASPTTEPTTAVDDAGLAGEPPRDTTSSWSWVAIPLAGGLVAALAMAAAGWRARRRSRVV